MVGDVTRLNVGVPRNAIRWQETTLYRIQSHGSADDIKRAKMIEVSTVAT